MRFWTNKPRWGAPSDWWVNHAVVNWWTEGAIRSSLVISGERFGAFAVLRPHDRQAIPNFTRLRWSGGLTSENTKWKYPIHQFSHGFTRKIPSDVQVGSLGQRWGIGIPVTPTVGLWSVLVILVTPAMVWNPRICRGKESSKFQRRHGYGSKLGTPIRRY